MSDVNERTRPSWPISAAAASVLGGHTSNHDRVYADASTLIVIDGATGGANPGPTASAGMAGALRGLAVVEQREGGEADAVGMVREAVRAAAELRVEQGTATITVGRLRTHPVPAFDLAWLGDSPAFLVRDGVLQQLTRAHNRAQELAEQRVLTYGEALASPLSNVLTRGIGAVGGEIETLSIPLRSGDRIVIASDGVFAAGPEGIGRAASEGDDARAVVDALVTAALAGHAADNVSVAALVVDGPRESATGLVAVPEGAVRDGAVRDGARSGGATAGDSSASDESGEGGASGEGDAAAPDDEAPPRGRAAPVPWWRRHRSGHDTEPIRGEPERSLADETAPLPDR
jgi:protein phosphatase/serine/threonine-protein phosphatase Stp1